ncbi:RabGAP/TBC [Delitschia confertaspora ATCC 74209]|uniref:RabGAP/TBC n=1 Tax=Delitschia confertaspora ATCC 74209 TaxID=1513339 RepID=A0A9P4JGC5_9PLEO|nr:RabGAP/TBC [Delitschia confertaspora ATCC 74209]
MSELPQDEGIAGPRPSQDESMAQNTTADPTPRYRPYRPPDLDFTPPTSPQFDRSPTPSILDMFPPRRPANGPAYERETYTPSPSASPSFGPTIPSPQIPLRHDFVLRSRQSPMPSPLNGGFPRAEQPASPTVRNFSGPTLPSDPRAIINPLASNPVNPGRTWRDSREEFPSLNLQRARGGTTSSSASGYYPALRSATSIGDYSPIRPSNRMYPAGAYRPDRGGTNWSQNERHWPIPDETRSSFRSAWTNNSSGFLDASCTERSSVFTKRSSTSDNRASLQSAGHFDSHPYSEERQSYADDNHSYSMEDAEDDEDDDDDDDEDEVISMIAMYEDGEEECEEALQQLDTNDFVSDEGYVSQSTAATSVNSSDLQRLSRDSTMENDSNCDPSRPSSMHGFVDNAPNYQQDVPEEQLQLEKVASLPPKISSSPKPLPKLSRKTSTDSIKKRLAEKAATARPRRNSNSIVERKSKLLLSSDLFNPPQQLLKSNTFDVKAEKPATKRQPLQTTVACPPLPKASLPTPTAQTFSPNTPVPRDRYGFKKQTKDISVDEYDQWNSKYEEHVTRRTKKWEALMQKHSLPTENPIRFPARSGRVERYIQKGIPPQWRGAAWFFYSGGPKMQAGEMKGVYRNLVRQCSNGKLSENDRDLIDRDLHRTFPDNVFFKPDTVATAANPTADPNFDTGEEAPIIHALRRVLQAFALNNPNIGYCQSLNFIAGLLLLFLNQDEEKAFIMLTIITREHLPGTHAKNLLNVDIGVLMMLIKDRLPAVWKAIDDIHDVNSGPGSNAHPQSNVTRLPTVSLATTSWFMSLFIGSLPIETVLRVWDQFLYEGSRVLFKVALAIFRTGEPQIKLCKGHDMMEVFQIVQTLPRRCLDPNSLLERVNSSRPIFHNLSQKKIEEHRAWWKDLLMKDKMGKGEKAPAPGLEKQPKLKRKTSKRFKGSFRVGR